MLSTSKTRLNYRPIIATIGITLLLWILSKWYYQDWFANPYKYPAKVASLSATVLMCWSIILATRLRLLDDYFLGLDKVYQVHKRIGKASFYLILLHPLFLAMDRLPDFAGFLQAMWFRRPEGDRYLLGQNVGVAGLLLMAALVTVTLWVKLPYHHWKRTHEWFGLVLLLIIAHVFTVDRDIAAYPLLTIWMWGLLLLAFSGFVYIRFLYRVLGPCLDYTVSSIEKIGDILELAFTPVQAGMDFRPSQFVYLVVHKEGITPEPHPYSIACGYNRKSEFKLGIKKSGDHTRSLDLLEKGDLVTVYGPYGHFSDKFLSAERDCVFIGGGIGITPFLGMWHVALHSEERPSTPEVSEEAEPTHPETAEHWRSPKVYLFYVCLTEDQASFDNDIKNEVILSHLHGFAAFEERGHHYELYLASRQGLITAEYVNRQVKGGVRDKNIFLCGPSPMVNSLIAQFNTLGVSDNQIIVEDFNLT
jgi:predicted ferric reductase